MKKKKDLDELKLDPSDPALREQTEAAIMAVCTFAAHQLKLGRTQAEIKAELLKEGLPESAVRKILALVASRPEAFLRRPRRARLTQVRGLLVSVVWLILGVLVLWLSGQPAAERVELPLRVVGWVAVVIGGLSLAWSGVVLYLTRRT